MLQNLIIKILIWFINYKWAGKDLNFCPRIYTNIYFETKCVRVCCHSTIVPYNPPILYIGNVANFSRIKYLITLINLMLKNTSKTPPCKDCNFFKKQFVPKFKLFNNFDFITLNQFKDCNSYCVYCGIEAKSRTEYTPIMNAIKKMEDLNLISEDVLFNWGGGEPTLCPEFNDIVDFLYKNNYRQAVNSSGIVFSDAILNGMKNNLISIQISPDAGTDVTYKKIKRQDNFLKVWENIKKYSEYPDSLFVKYIVFSMNSDSNEIEQFVEKCKSSNVKNIVVDCEFNSMHGNHTLFGKISDKEISAAKLLKKLAENQGMNVSISHQWRDEALQRIKSDIDT